MGSRGKFEDSGLTGISPELREYSEIDRIDGHKVLRWDAGKNNRSPVYSNTPDTIYYSYSSKRKCIEKILFFKDHRLVKSIDMEKGNNPAHVHKWSHAGSQVGRIPHDPNNIFKLSREDMKFYLKAKSWNDGHK